MRHFKVVCDLETSGNCPINNGVISACFFVLNESDEIVNKKTWYVRPPNLSPKFWSEEARIKAHKIPYETVLGFMQNDQFCYELLCFLGQYQEHFPLAFICHASNTGMPNLDPITKKSLGGYAMVPWFDWNFLEWCFRKAFFQNGEPMVNTFWKIFKHNEICIEMEEGKEDKTKLKLLNGGTALISTIVMARELGFKPNKLSDWSQRLGFQLNHHEVESDTNGAYITYKYLKAKYESHLRNKQQTSVRGRKSNVRVPRTTQDVKQVTLFGH
jgi:hypothetical protein